MSSSWLQRPAFRENLTWSCFAMRRYCGSLFIQRDKLEFKTPISSVMVFNEARSSSIRSMANSKYWIFCWMSLPQYAPTCVFALVRRHWICTYPSTLAWQRKASQDNEMRWRWYTSTQHEQCATFPTEHLTVGTNKKKSYRGAVPTSKKTNLFKSTAKKNYGVSYSPIITTQFFSRSFVAEVKS